jgi:hypothetical protein
MSQDDKKFIHVPTQEDSERVQEKLFSMGKQWGPRGKTVISEPSKSYGDKACLSLEESKYMGYCWKGWYLDEDYTEINLEDFLNNTNEGNKVMRKKKGKGSKFKKGEELSNEITKSWEGCYVMPKSNNNGHNYTIGKLYLVVEDKCAGNYCDLDYCVLAKSETGYFGNNLEKRDCKLYAPYKGESEKSIFDILVLSDEVRELILTTVDQAKDEVSNKIFEEWGFGETIEKGKGSIMLFYGPPGTGKTMAAEGIAAMLDKDHIMLGSGEFQSSVPGETERNISKAFKDATQKDLVVILDECDSILFSRRGVGGILAAEINTLLREIERFEGVCVMTTNRSVVLDDALERRVSLKLEFNKPPQEVRAKIWRNLIPKKAPLGECVDFTKLSEFELTGGQIKNIILASARSAAYKKKESIEYVDMETAIKGEIKRAEAFNKEGELKLEESQSSMASIMRDVEKGMGEQREPRKSMFNRLMSRKVKEVGNGGSFVH